MQVFIRNVRGFRRPVGFIHRLGDRDFLRDGLIGFPGNYNGSLPDGKTALRLGRQHIGVGL